MKAKEYLNQIKHIESEIESLKLEREVLFNRTIRRADLSDMKVQSNGGRDVFLEIGEHILKLQDKSDQLIRLRLDMSERIDKVVDPQYRQLLRFRYLIGMRWEDISQVMHYEIRSIYRLHGKALLEFEQVNKDVSKCQ